MRPSTKHAAIIALLAALATAQDPAATAPPARPRGLAVTYEPLDPDQRAKEGTHTYRTGLLSLGVERGETPTPMLSPGMFKATFRAVVPLAVRDRYRFQIAGRGSVRLSINGESVLAGPLRPGRPLETTEPVRLKKGDNELVCEIESNAQGEAQLRVLWAGPTFALEPLAPELLQWPADDPDIAAGERLRAGHQLFVERRCAHCHLPERALGESAFGELEQQGPDLRNVGARLHPAWVAEWLADPRAVRPEANMPRLRLEATDAADLAAFLATQGSPLPDQPLPRELGDRGAVRFRELGCIACHLPPDERTDPVTPGRRIALQFVPKKWRAAALVQYLLDPRQSFPDVRMPHFQLDADDARALAAFLLRTASTPPAVKGDAERGRHLAQRHGCDHCHQLTLPEMGLRFQELRALNAERGCLAGASGSSDKAPDFALTGEQLAALRAFLPHALAATQRRSPLDYAARMVPALRCTNCHGRNSEPSVWARLAAVAAATEPLPPEQDPVAQGVPALTWVGSKLQPSWMERFVSGREPREPSPRPWLHARMPSFGARGVVVVAGLVREQGYASQDEPEQPPDAQLALQGQRLVKMGEGLGCVQCHGIGSQPPVQVFERQGINFRVASRRLRKDYYMRWLLDPLRIDPEAKMPKFADAKGKTAFTDVLGGDAARQFDAIWHFFRTLE